MRRIGVLMSYAESDAAAQSWLAAFRGTLAKLGWTEGNNLQIEIRWGAGNADKIRTLAKRAGREMRNPTAMVAAIKEKGVLSRKRVERSERGALGEFDWIENASAEELLAFLAGELGNPDISAAKH
jgi:hypothetical protein